MSLTPFFFDSARLPHPVGRYQAEFAAAHPFHHVVIDDFLPAQAAEDLHRDFIETPRERFELFHKEGYADKYVLKDVAKMSPYSRLFFGEMNAAPMVQFLETMSGIPALIPDPYYTGGGFQEIQPGGTLEVHADFNWNGELQLYRRVNALIYLNKDWKPEYNGDLQLWNADARSCEKRVYPIFNRCVIFETTSSNFHGHPLPLKCPPGMSRKSAALFYYTREAPPGEEDLSPRKTLWKQTSPGSAGS